MDENVDFVPPDTGASTICAPVSNICLDACCATWTSRVVESTKNRGPSLRGSTEASASRIPDEPRYTFVTCGEDGSMVKMVLLWRVTLSNRI